MATPPAHGHPTIMIAVMDHKPGMAHQLPAASKSGADTCPTCGQPMPHEMPPGKSAKKG